MGTVGRRGASSPRELTRVGDRLSFVYLERCVVHRDSNAITAQDAQGWFRLCGCNPDLQMALEGGAECVLGATLRQRLV